MKRKHGRSLQSEECGVWLDTTQLKKRSHQTVLPCSYSTKFNPQSRQHADFVFDFTQTKTPQLCTKQTSMYAFFAPKDKTTAQLANQENLPPHVSMIDNAGEKDVIPTNTGQSMYYKAISCTEAGECLDDYSFHVCRDTEEAALLKENKYDSSRMTGSSNHKKAPMESLLKTDEELLLCPADIRAYDPAIEKAVPLLDSQISSLGPKVHLDNLYSESPQDSQLFTQDSQGNRVIAHRSASEQPKTHYLGSVLQDRTNVSWDTYGLLKRSHQFMCEEDSSHDLFTQDSEGNKVIKH
ncbi:aurora kinase A- and ninein-interacting protein [Hyperolius riggenbachi]|uniref:aurora kinase A- and ninein-interacting protein n=1 Tax=Hyperolius riggenbachi TaxID=752182 RepID=UPI0035A2749B